MRRISDNVAGEYEWTTYSQFGVKVKQLAGGLVSLGAKPHSNIGLYSVNRLEWNLAEFACYYNKY
jgi:long-chain acyl-CoA synthetase